MLGLLLLIGAAGLYLSMFGRQLLGTVGVSLTVWAGPDARIVAKKGGGTIDWGTVAIVNAGADTTWLDNFVVPAGKKALRYGQILCRITSGPTAGYFGPYDPAATDGRQTLSRGDVFFIAESVVQTDWAADNPPLYEGGDVYSVRMIALTSGTHSLAAGPTFAELMPLLPLLRLVTDDMANP